MKVLVISYNSPELSSGGIERYIDNYLNYCLDKNKETVFLLPQSKFPEEETKGNVKIFRKRFLLPTFKKIYGQLMIPPEEISLLTQQFYDFILDIKDKENIDLVYVQNFHKDLPPAYSLVLNMAFFQKQIPGVLSIHSFPGKDIQVSIINDLFWNKLICVSKSVAGDCYQKGIDITRMITRYLGVNIQKFNLSLDPYWLKNHLGLPLNQKVILHASRIISGQKNILKEKGFNVLVEAFSKIVSRYQNCSLVFAIAQPPERLMLEYKEAVEKLKGYLELYGLADKVIIKNFGLNQMPLVYRGSDVFVMASENETFGQVYIESMACGTPVIGTNVGGVSEIIRDNFNGFLIPPNDASILAQKISRLLKNKKIADNFRNSALNIVKSEFSTEKHFDDLYQDFSLIKEQKSSTGTNLNAVTENQPE